MSRKKEKKRILVRIVIGILIFLFLVFIFFVVKPYVFGPRIEEEKVLLEKKDRASKEEEEKAEKEKKKEEEEKKEETEKESEGNLYQSKTTPLFSFIYPFDWQLSEKNAKDISLRPKLASSEEISVVIKDNPVALEAVRFYDGINDVNLFEDAQGGFEKIDVGGKQGYKFKDVYGYTLSTVVVVSFGSYFMEITDIYNLHQEDGKFKQIIDSIKFEE